MNRRVHYGRPSKEFKSSTTKMWSKDDNPKLSLEAADFIVGKVVRIAQGQIQSKDLENKKTGYAIDRTLAYMLQLSCLGAMPHDSLDNSTFLQESVEPVTLRIDNLASSLVGVETKEIAVTQLVVPSPLKSIYIYYIYI